MLTAGGTGGHLFPAFSLAQELAPPGLGNRSHYRYAGSIAMVPIFPARETYRVPAATLAGKNPISVAKTIAKLGSGTVKARAIIKKVKPSAIVGFGGYPTFPPMFAAKSLKIPAVLHEQNAVMGRANRMLAGKCQAIAPILCQNHSCGRGVGDQGLSYGQSGARCGD